MKAVALTLVITLITAVSAQASTSDCPKRSNKGLFANTNPSVQTVAQKPAPATQTQGVR